MRVGSPPVAVGFGHFLCLRTRGASDGNVYKLCGLTHFWGSFGA